MLDLSTVETPETVEDFQRVVGKIQNSQGYREHRLYALGSRVCTQDGQIASARFPVVNGPGQNAGAVAIMQAAFPFEEGEEASGVTIEQVEHARRMFKPFRDDGKVHHNIDMLDSVLDRLQSEAAMRKRYTDRFVPETPVVCGVFEDVAPSTIESGTLRLYGISNRHYKPREQVLDGLFGLLPNVAWIDDQPFSEEGIDHLLKAATFYDEKYSPHLGDKFPLYMHRINHAAMKVRILDQNKVRLGAYLGEGSTLMPGASYVNFNAGVGEGCMIEGRVSSEVWVGDHCDIGGGASIIGTLSGGNTTPVTIGAHSFLEANSITGTSTGIGVIVAAGDRFLASSRIRVDIEGHPSHGKILKGHELGGENWVTFRRNDSSGTMEMVQTRRNLEMRKKVEEEHGTILNDQLHSNN